MASKRRWIGGALLLGAVLLLIGLLLRARGPGSVRTGMAVSGGSSAPRTALLEPVARHPRDSTTRDGDGSDAPGTDPEDTPLPDLEYHWWFMTVNLHWEGSFHAETLTVEASQGPNLFLLAQPSENGSVTDRLWDDRLSDASPILVSLRMGQSLLAKTEVDPLTARRSVVDGHIEHRLVVNLGFEVPARVHGQVVDPDGTPISDAGIGVFRKGGASTPPIKLATGSTGQTGFFAITGIQEPAVLVVARDGFRPKSISIEPRGGDVDLGVIRLNRGSSIRGRLALRPFEENKGLTVRMDLKGGTWADSLFQDRVYSWLDERYETGMVEVPIGEDGTFEVSGLAPALYEISYSGRVDGGACFRKGRPIDPPVLVRAPATGVELILETPRVWVHVVDEDGKDLPPLHAKFVEESGWSCSADVKGGLLLEILPEETLSFTVSADGFHPQTLQVRVPPGGNYAEYEVCLHHASPASRIVLVPKPGEEIHPDRLELRMWFLEEEQPQQLNDWSTLDADRDGRFVIQHVFPGRYNIDLRPYRDAGLRTYWRVRRIQVEVKAGQDAKAQLVYARAGKLAVRVVDSGGDLLSLARCEVFATGSPDPLRGIRFVDFDPGTRSIGLLPIYPHPGNRVVRGFVEVSPALPASTYTVVASLEGYLEAARTVNVEKGKTTKVELVLQATGQ